MRNYLITITNGRDKYTEVLFSLPNIFAAMQQVVSRHGSGYAIEYVYSEETHEGDGKDADNAAFVQKSLRDLEK